LNELLDLQCQLEVKGSLGVTKIDPVDVPDAVDPVDDRIVLGEELFRNLFQVASRSKVDPDGFDQIAPLGRIVFFQGAQDFLGVGQGVIPQERMTQNPEQAQVVVVEDCDLPLAAALEDADRLLSLAQAGRQQLIGRNAGTDSNRYMVKDLLLPDAAEQDADELLAQ
jgi:hypothetical protein